MPYDQKINEAKWQKFWSDKEVYRTDDDSSREKFYVLAQFPYPSGSGLHMGHASIYTYTDVIARFKRHQGYEVLHPMGWDAFGLPTEQSAIKEGIHPAKITERNIKTFKAQLNRLGLSYDWNREVNTTDPEYYKWTQWIFKRLHEAGLTYKAEVAVNWCPELKTVLADEEVIDGKSERGGYPVVRRQMSQWMFRITDYAQKLLDGLDDLDWPESSKKAQRDWIGRSEGAKVLFGVQGRDEKLEVYTTRPDTLFGATYMVLAPEHPLVESITTKEQQEEVKAYQKAAARKSDFDRAEMAKDKTGVFTGAYGVNPVNGEAIPIWIADYVLISYGTGAIMAVPAHDTRDFEFAQAFDIPITQVLLAKGEEPGELSEPMIGDGTLINSSNDDLDINGLNKKEAITKTIAWLESKGLGEKKVNYKLRDWVFARQRYWGEPFPMIKNAEGEWELIPDSDLPLTLPEVESYQPTDTGESPLAAIRDWVEQKDAEGRSVERETDTMPNWAGSCWYYLRFMDPTNPDSFASLDRQKRWGRVDVYVGGTEHLNLHDLYSRFWHRALFDLGIMAEPEPFQKLLHQGMVLGHDNKKMSKSLGNIVNPDDVIDKYGTDILRLNLCFLGPVESNKPWSDTGLQAMDRFQQRLWRLIEEKDQITEEALTGDLLALHHKTIKAVSQDMENYRFNTAIARLMEYMNALLKADKRPVESLKGFALLISPLAPHIAESMWEALGEQGGVTRVTWPTYDESLCKVSSVEIAIQFNGKIKLRLDVPADLDAKGQEEHVFGLEDFKKAMPEGDVKKVISVPGRLVNVIVR